MFSDEPGSTEWRFADGSKAGREIRISGRLWMNSLDALAAAAREGAGIVRVPSWQAESDLAAGRLVHLVERWRGIDAVGAQPASTYKQNRYSILKPCRMAVVYQATDQSRLIAA
ncbi:LysR substrate-binding domain-containing protein [Bradyrhizobium sp. RDT10]